MSVVIQLMKLIQWSLSLWNCYHSSLDILTDITFPLKTFSNKFLDPLNVQDIGFMALWIHRLG